MVGLLLAQSGEADRASPARVLRTPDHLHAAAVRVDANDLCVGGGRLADVAGRSDRFLELAVGTEHDELPAVWDAPGSLSQMTTDWAAFRGGPRSPASARATFSRPPIARSIALAPPAMAEAIPRLSDVAIADLVYYLAPIRP
jgi:hypothetical protein